MIFLCPEKFGKENLVVVYRVNGSDFLQFETISLCPFDRRLIDKTLLNASEIRWINSYHKAVSVALLPFVQGPARSWLEAACLPL